MRICLFWAGRVGSLLRWFSLTNFSRIERDEKKRLEYAMEGWVLPFLVAADCETAPSFMGILLSLYGDQGFTWNIYG